MKEKIVQVSMKIILHAGDARQACMDSLDSIANFNYDQAQEQLIIARNYITKAHQAQTYQIQAEVGHGHEMEYSLLFAHAQDTLMTVMAEINISKKMLAIALSWEQRWKNMEENKDV